MKLNITYNVKRGTEFRRLRISPDARGARPEMFAKGVQTFAFKKPKEIYNLKKLYKSGQTVVQGELTDVSPVRPTWGCHNETFSYIREGDKTRRVKSEYSNNLTKSVRYEDYSYSVSIDVERNAVSILEKILKGRGFTDKYIYNLFTAAQKENGAIYLDKFGKKRVNKGICYIPVNCYIRVLVNPHDPAQFHVYDQFYIDKIEIYNVLVKETTNLLPSYFTAPALDKTRTWQKKVEDVTITRYLPVSYRERDMYIVGENKYTFLFHKGTVHPLRNFLNNIRF